MSNPLFSFLAASFNMGANARTQNVGAAAKRHPTVSAVRSSCSAENAPDQEVQRAAVISVHSPCFLYKSNVPSHGLCAAAIVGFIR